MTGAESFVLHVSRRKAAQVTAVSAIAVFLGVRIVRTGSAFAWLAVAFFGLGLIIGLWQLIAPNALVVTPTTLTTRTLWRVHDWDLASCGQFVVWRNPAGGQKFVVFDHPLDMTKKTPPMSIRSLSGRSSRLPDTFGLEASVLAGRLNDARAAARANAGPTG